MKTIASYPHSNDTIPRGLEVLGIETFGPQRQKHEPKIRYCEKTWDDGLTDGNETILMSRYITSAGYYMNALGVDESSRDDVVDGLRAVGYHPEDDPTLLVPLLQDYLAGVAIRAA